MGSAPARSLRLPRAVCAVYFALIGGVVILADRGALPISAVVPYDVVLHFVLLGLAGWLLHLALDRKRWGWLPVGPTLVAIGATFEELSQAFVPARTFSWADMAANVSGVVVVYALDELWVRLRPTLVARARHESQ
jgi:hypothetical protein